jgi:hypothetical protein
MTLKLWMPAWSYSTAVNSYLNPFDIPVLPNLTIESPANKVHMTGPRYQPIRQAITPV